MCLIIQREPNFEIPYDKFESAIHTNPDGYGLSFPDEGKLRTLKSHHKADPENLYRVVNEELIELPLLIHFRFNTAGKTNLRNAHPFPILEHGTDGIDLRMAHNGTIGKYKTIAQTDESDTRAFVREFVRPLFKRMIKAVGPEELLKDEFTKKLLEDQIPKGSVLSFLDSQGNTLNVNETGNGGKKEDGWYYSNSYSFNRSHRETETLPYGQTSYYNMGDWKYPDTKSNKMGDTNVTKFTKKYEVSLEDLALFTDDTIDMIVKEAPDDAILLVKEVLHELYLKGKKV